MGARLSKDVPASVVDAVWLALRDGSEPAWPNALPVFVNRFRGADLVPCYALLDLVDDLGLRDLAHVDGLLPAFGVPVVAGFARPSARLRMCVGTSHTTTADAAAFLIDLERHGLPVDPSPLVDALRPALARKAVLTSSELAIWWHRQEQHRREPTVLMADGLKAVSAQAVRTVGGYRVETWLTANGRAVSLSVRSPRFRRRRAVR